MHGEFPPPPGAWKLDGGGMWYPAAEPVHPNDGRGQGVGPGLAFARAVLQEFPAAAVLLVPCAVGATGMRHWRPGTTLYEAAVKRARCGVASSGGTLAGVLWHQGEDDAARPGEAAKYEKSFRELVARLRKDLGAPDVPFVCGEIGEAFLSKLSELPKGERTWRADKHCADINRALHTVTAELSHAAIIESATTCLDDGLHYDSAAHRLMGQRYAAAWVQLYNSHTALQQRVKQPAPTPSATSAGTSAALPTAIPVATPAAPSATPAAPQKHAVEQAVARAQAIGGVSVLAGQGGKPVFEF